MNFHTLGSLLAFASVTGSAAAMAGCNNTPPPVATAYVSASINNSTDPMYLSLCEVGSSTNWLSIGSDSGKGLPMTVDDGSSAHVSCSVKQTGMDQFDISLTAEQPGSNGGTLTITGTGVSSTGGMGLEMTSETAAGYGSLQSMSCTLDYSNAAGRVSGPPISAGRIWGHVSCAAAMDSSHPAKTKQLPDGGSATVTCSTEADFLFENCSQ